MRLLIRGLAVSCLLILTVLSALLLILFSRHDRLLSINGDAVLRQPGGHVIAVAPGLGAALDWLRRPVWLAGLVLLPAGSIVLYEGRRLWRGYARPGYSARLES
jgi:hypothetical protein